MDELAEEESTLEDDSNSFLRSEFLCQASRDKLKWAFEEVFALKKTKEEAKKIIGPNWTKLIDCDFANGPKEYGLWEAIKD